MAPAFCNDSLNEKGADDGQAGLGMGFAQQAQGNIGRRAIHAGFRLPVADEMF